MKAIQGILLQCRSMPFSRQSAARHAALTEQAQRLMQQERPSVTDLRMYNMMMTRESISASEGLLCLQCLLSMDVFL